MAWSGRRADFERLVEDHLTDALHFAIRLTGDVEQAEEVVQDAMVNASRSWRSYRGVSRFRTWLFRIVVNAFRDRLRQQPCEENLAHEPLDRRHLTGADVLVIDELRRLIAQRVSRLPARQREVLVLASYQGLSAREIASVLEITENNVHATLHAARGRLRQELNQYLAGR